MIRIKVLSRSLDLILQILNQGHQFHPQIGAILREGINTQKVCRAIINQL